MMFKCFCLLSILVTLLCVLEVRGYIPAQPSNFSVQESGQVVEAPRLHVQWYTNGSDWEYVTRRLAVPDASNDPVQGILVHFTEDNAGNETTTTPWIAFISCDANSTNSSGQADIFGMAKDRGAKSAILYSLYSETCVISPDYQTSALDVFTTQTLNASRHIEYEFGQFGPSSEAYHGYFNAMMLNDTAGVLNNTIAFDYPTAPGFLFATLSIYNTSGADGGTQADDNGTATSTSTDSDSGDTGIAMIILYAITGCVSALFCGVVVSGAIRALRHPERYGPRPSDPTLGGGQSRAGGLGRAILDTFPVVKFGSSGSDREPRPKDIESAPMDPESSIHVQLAQLSNAADHDEHHDDAWEGPVATTSQEPREDNQAPEGTDQVNVPPQINTAEHRASREPTSSQEMPEYIGRDTCPICIVDFEEGDDLRVLPCEGKHAFHQSCVDPWLLELSASCPICRQDFRALETMISGGSENEGPPVNRESISGTSIRQSRRFSRYLRFALGRQRRVSSTSGDQESPPPLES
ncbi:hypothetical protein EV363DRAFT_1211911 [Boletus edulis]|nr:hypothetical protein EV363DRAFT_1211911 [Boletus edulis]